MSSLNMAQEGFSGVGVPDHLSLEEDLLCTRMKFLCSYGGKILPRPSDGKLRYVGGETRIIVVNRDISYEELMSKMMDLYGQIMTLKYQLPDEDLDALVSVSSNEDLENMVDEYNRLETGEICPKLRVFLFSTVEHDVPYTHESGEKNSLEQLYLDAINGITDAASKKQIDSSVVNTTHPLDNLIGFDVVDSWYVSSSLETSVSHHNSNTQSFHVPQHSSMPEFPPAYNPQLLVYLDNRTSSRPILPFQEHFSNTGCQEIIESVSDPACNSESAISAPMTSNFQPNYGHNSKVWKPSDSFSQFLPDPLPSEICQDPPMQSEHGCVNEVRKPTSLIPNSSPQTDVLTSGFESGTVPISLFTNKLDSIPSENRQEFLTKTEENFLGEGLPRACNEQAMQLLEPIVQQSFWPDYIDFNLGIQQSIAILQTPVDFHNTVQHRQLSVQQECTGNQQNPLYIIDQYQMPTTIQVEPELQGSESFHPQLVTITDQWQVEEQQRQNELMAITMNCFVPSKSLNPSTFSEVISFPPCHGEAPALLNLPGSDSYGRSMGLRHVKTKRSMYGAFPKTQQTDRGSDLPDEQTFLYPSPRTHSFEAFNDCVLQSERKPYLETPILSQGEVTNELKCTYDGSSISYSHGRTHPASPMIPSYSPQKKIYDGISYCHQHQDGVDWANQEAQQVMEVDGNMQYQPQQSIAEIDIRGRFVEPSDVDDRFWQLETQQQNANDQLLKDQYEPDNLQFQTDNAGRASRIEVSHEKPNQVPNFVNQMRALPKSDAKVITSKDMAILSASALEDTFSKEHKSCADFLGHEHIKPFLLQQKFSAGKPEPRHLDKIFSGSDYPLDFNHAMRNEFTPVELPTASRMAIHGAATASSLQHFKEQPYFEDQKSEEEVLQYATSKGIASQSPGHLLQNRLDKLEERFEFQDLSRMPSVGMNGKNLQSPNNLTRDTPEEFQVWDLDAGKININPIQNSLISIDNEIDQAFSTAFKDLVNVQASQPSSYEEETYQTSKNVFNTRNSGTSSFSVTSICLAQNPATMGCPSAQKDFVALDVLHYDEQSLQNVADETKGLTSLCANELVSTAVDHLEKSAALHSENNRNSAGQLIENDNLLQEALHANGIMDKVNEMMPDKVVEYHATVNANEEGKLCDKDSSLFLLDEKIVLASSQSKLQREKHSWGSKKPSDVTVAEISHAQNALELNEGKPTSAKAVVIEERRCSLSTIAKDADFEGGASSAEAEAIARGLQTIKNSDLEELQELGSGTYGTVYHGKWRGSDVAIKRIKSSCFNKKPSERERLIADFWREACTLSQLHHPNVVAFYGVVPDGPDGTLATVTEFMLNGSLKQVLQRKDRTIDRRRRLLIAMDAAFGMEYLHEKKIVHFDLKCENLLVNMRDPHRPVCKVGDLGLSKVKHQTMVSGGVRGTLPWMAPELLNGRSSLVSEKVDIFSFGIVMWELLTCEEPYTDLHYGAIIGGIVNNTLRPAIPDWCDPLWRSLMVRCWSNEPGERPSFSQISSELRAMATSQNTKVQGQTQVHI